MFYFTCNESKIYKKVSLFEISYKKKMNFFTIFIFFLDVPVYQALRLAATIKGLLHRKMTILSLIIYPHVVSNP